MTFSLKALLFATILLSFISTTGSIFAQSYDNNSNITSQSKSSIATKSPVLSDPKHQAIINAAMNVPGLKAWSNQWQYLSMGFIGTTSGSWQNAVVYLRLPVNASAPLHCVFPIDAMIKVDLSTNQVIEANYPTLKNFNCNFVGSGPIGTPHNSNNTVIKNTTAYNMYLANYGINSTVPEFPENSVLIMTFVVIIGIVITRFTGLFTPFKLR
jgi:hypothetical protein